MSSHPSNLFDVAVIGAGPSGSFCARLLAEQGHSVVLLEDHSEPGQAINCSGIIGVEAFQKFDLPRDSIVSTIDVLRFYSPGGNILEYRHPDTLALAVDRARFDLAMANRAVSAGCLLLTSSRVNRIELTEDEAHLTIQGDKGSPLRARFVVIATGAGSSLTKQIGLGTPDKYVLGAQAICEQTWIDQVEVHLGSKIAPSNFAWIIPLEPGRAKVGLICRKNAKRALYEFISSLQADGRAGEFRKVQCSLLPLTTIRKSFTHRTLVIGEAAGQIKTVTCGGIYYGLLAAEIAGNVLGEALRSAAHNGLSRYELEWKSLLAKELRMGLRLRYLFERLSDNHIDSLFEIAGKDGIMKIIREKASFDWHYDLVSAILRHSMVASVLKPSIFYRPLVNSI